MGTLHPGDLVILKEQRSSSHASFLKHHGVGRVTKVEPVHPASDKIYCRVLFSKTQSRMQFLEKDLKKITSPLEARPAVITFAVQDGDTQ